jgi:hypothetical protein
MRACVHNTGTLQVAVGKLFYRLALSYSDRAIEAYDVLVALLESELGLLLANCRAAGIGNQNSAKGEWKLHELKTLILASIMYQVLSTEIS